jgi:winged helix DNA-binding protein
VGTVLVGGQVAGAWSAQKGRITVEPYEPLTRSVHNGIDEEAERLAAFHA